VSYTPGMYDIALSVAACARSGTRADVAWMLSPVVTDEALAFTPGGGQVGSIMGGAFDGVLADVASRKLSSGRLIRHVVTTVESAVCGLPEGSTVEFLLVPADQFPAQLWPQLMDRETVVISAAIEDNEVTSLTLAEGISERDAPAATSGRPAVFVDGSEITTVLTPITRLVIAGQGPIADALAAQGVLLEWKSTVESRPGMVAGLAAGLSELDGIVVMGHDVEITGTYLMSALESRAGYIGALGSESMQQTRADWLALREVTDLSRVRGPAGLDIGSRDPAEIAVAIAAQMILNLRLP
jgi:xanthine dehydrogenase accessory factor